MDDSIGKAEETATEAAETGQQKHRRVNVRVPMRISTVDPDRDPKTGKLYFFTSEEVSANISCGGAFVTTPEDLPMGRRVLVEIDIPNGANIQTLGRVVWKRLAPGRQGLSPANRPGVGIEFVGGRHDQMRELDRYINAASRRPVAPAGLGVVNHSTA